MMYHVSIRIIKQLLGKTKTESLLIGTLNQPFGHTIQSYNTPNPYIPPSQNTGCQTVACCLSKLGIQNLSSNPHFLILISTGHE